MTTRIVLQHTTGAKANQIEQFPLDGTTEISFGRDPANNVAFDATRDDAASRRHAVLRITASDPPRFTLADLGSANGTFVNGARLHGERDLDPGDTIEFGAGGPKLVFDVQPRPANFMARTRIMSAPGASPDAARATRISQVPGTSQVQGTASTPGPIPTKVGVGRETVQRMLGEQKRATSRTWMYVLAGVLVLVGGAGLWLKISADQAARDQAAKLAAAQAAMNASLQKEQRDREAKMGMSAEEIAHKYGNATVQIFMAWRAIDKDTGRRSTTRSSTSRASRSRAT